MKVEDIQHGGDHYKDQPKHLQPIWLAIALNLNAMEYSVLKYLLRHRKKGGLEDLKKMVHFAQMLMEHEYGVCPVVVYPEQDSPSDVSGEEDDKQCPVNVMPHIPQCPFKIGDIVFYWERRDDEPRILWKVWKISPSGVEVRGPDADHHCSFIPAADYGKWKNYVEDCGNAEKAVDPDPCPFKVGDVIRRISPNLRSRWIVKEIDWERERIWLANTNNGIRASIGKLYWNRYERVPDEPEPQAKDKLPKVGDRYKRLVEGTPLYRVLMVSDKGIVQMGKEGSQGLPHYVEWELDFDKYELQESPSTSRYPFVGEIYKRKDDGKCYRVYKLEGNYVWFEDIKSGTIHVADWAAGRSSYYERVTDETK
jgi:hypothetical protein